MQNQHSLKLIEGIFSGEDGKEVLLSLVNYKINFHKRRILSTEERFGYIEEASVKRIKELEAVRDEILQMTTDAQIDGMHLKVRSDVYVEFIAPSAASEKLVDEMQG